MNNTNNNQESVLPQTLGEATLKLTKKMLVEGDIDEGLAPFYAYDFENNESGMIGSIDVYVAVNNQSRAQFNELQVGQTFRLIPTK